MSGSQPGRRSPAGGSTTTRNGRLRGRPVQATEHRLEREAVHFQWDRSLSPALRIRDGETVHLRTREVSGGQVQYGAPTAVVTRLDRGRTHPLPRPVYVEAAPPRGGLPPHVLQLISRGLGWT